MKSMTMAVAMLLASIFMTACGNRESAAPAEEAAPATTAAPTEAAPAATSEAMANDEDAGQTSGDKVAPK